MGGFSIVQSTKKHQKAKNDFFEKIRGIKPLKDHNSGKKKGN